MSLEDRLERALGRRPAAVRRLSGGDVGSVSLVEFADSERLVVKQPGAGGADTADVEARMLRHLSETSALPVPEVVHVEPGLLAMTYLEGSSGLSKAAEADAGRHIARLHGVTAERFGLAFDTVIGPLPQPNPSSEDWAGFFAEHRLTYMARLAEEAGRLPSDLRRRCEALAGRVADLVVAPKAPELVHGDLWGGNILAAGGRVTGFIDPAIYYGHGEMDLAFITLFGSAGDAFFAAYREIRPIAEGFSEVRRDLYNLWPLLVHVRLFGGAYVGRVEAVVGRLGA